MSDAVDNEPDPKAREKTMGFWDHLGELRLTIIKGVIAFVVCAGLVGYYLNEFQSLVLGPFEQAVGQYPDLEIRLGTNGMTEGMSMILDFCLFGGLTFAAPFILFFVAQFVAPALTRKEMKAVVPFCLSACLLFLGGVAFAYFFLMPAAVDMFIKINLSQDLAFRWSMGDYYGIFTRTVFGVGAAFEFPLLIVMFVWIGIIDTAFLRRYRRHAMVLIVFIAAFMNQSNDPLSQALCAAPLYLLYEASIWVSFWIEKHRERSGAAVLVALLALWPRGQPAQNLRMSRA